MADTPSFTIKRTSDPTDERFIKALICGEPGTGKTLSSSTWPGALLVTAEGLIMSLKSSGRDIPYVEISSTDELAEIIKLLRRPEAHEENFGFKVETLVIDTLDEICDLFVREKLREERRSAMQLQDYGWLKERMKGLSRSLRGLKMNVVLNCHLKSKTVDDQSFYIPALEGAFSEEIAGYIDLSVVMRTRLATVVEGGQSKRVIQRYLQTFPEEPRFKFIKDHSGKLPQEFPINFEDDYQRLYDYIYGNKSAPDAAQVTVTPDAAPSPKKGAAEDETSEPALSPELTDEAILEEIAN